MIQKDTVRLLRECNAGIKIGVTSIGRVQEEAVSPQMRKYLSDCKNKHEELQSEIQALLYRYCDKGKSPSPVALWMSKLKTQVKMTLNRSDATIADLITDGCNMGVKSLSRFLNQYKTADEKAKDLTRRLIALETALTESLRPYL